MFWQRRWFQRNPHLLGAQVSHPQKTTLLVFMASQTPMSYPQSWWGSASCRSKEPQTTKQRFENRPCSLQNKGESRNHCGSKTGLRSSAQLIPYDLHRSLQRYLWPGSPNHPKSATHLPVSPPQSKAAEGKRVWFHFSLAPGNQREEVKGMESKCGMATCKRKVLFSNHGQFFFEFSLGTNILQASGTNAPGRRLSTHVFKGSIIVPSANVSATNLTGCSSFIGSKLLRQFS